MFKRITQRFQDMRALSILVQAAEHVSQKRNEGNKPSAEHFVLAAIESQDGAARSVFQKLGIDAANFEEALREQYKNSLNAIGIDVDDASLRVSDDSTDLKSTGLPQATESGSELLRNMSQQNQGRAFSGADVLRAIDSVSPGPAHRAFTIMGTTAEKVAAAAEEYLRK